MKAKSKNANKTSQKYEGVRSKELSSGDTAYYVRWSDKKGERHEVKVGTKFGGWSEKKASLRRIELQNSHNGTKSPKIAEVAERYLEIQKLHIKSTSMVNYRARVGYVVQYFGDKLVAEITQKDINSLKVELGKKLTNKTINTITCTFGAILKLAKSEWGVENNAFDGVKNLKVDNARERFLSIDEVRILLDRLNNQSETLLFVVLSLSTGARLMSVLDIRKKDIDLNARQVVLRDFKNSSIYGGFLDTRSCELLKERLPKLKDDERVILRSKRTIVESLRPILNELFNQNNPSNKQKVVIHTLRHTFASHLAIKGTPIHIIQKLLNHKDIKMTMRYAHLLPSSGREYVENLWG